MPAKRKTQSKMTRKKTTMTHRSQGFAAEYARQREEFYRSHPRIRVLLGLLIVSFALAIGVLIYNKSVVFVGLTLDTQYGIRYPYVDHGFTKKP